MRDTQNCEEKHHPLCCVTCVYKRSLQIDVVVIPSKKLYIMCHLFWFIETLTQLFLNLKLNRLIMKITGLERTSFEGVSTILEEQGRLANPIYKLY